MVASTSFFLFFLLFFSAIEGDDGSERFLGVSVSRFCLDRESSASESMAEDRERVLEIFGFVGWRLAVDGGSGKLGFRRSPKTLLNPVWICTVLEFSGG